MSGGGVAPARPLSFPGPEGHGASHLRGRGTAVASGRSAHLASTAYSSHELAPAAIAQPVIGVLLLWLSFQVPVVGLRILCIAALAPLVIGVWIRSFGGSPIRRAGCIYPAPRKGASAGAGSDWDCAEPGAPNQARRVPVAAVVSKARAHGRLYRGVDVQLLMRRSAPRADPPVGAPRMLGCDGERSGAGYIPVASVAIPT